MLFIILAGLFGGFVAVVCGTVAYAVFKGKKRASMDYFAAFMLSAVGLGVLFGLPYAAYQAVLPKADDSNRLIAKTDVYQLQRIAPGESVIIGDISSGSSNTSPSCTGYVFRDEDGNVQMIGTYLGCARPGDDFKKIDVNESDVDVPKLKVEWLVAPTQEYDYGWFGIDFKMNNWETDPSYKQAILEVPSGEKLELASLTHQ